MSDVRKIEIPLSLVWGVLLLDFLCMFHGVQASE